MKKNFTLLATFILLSSAPLLAQEANQITVEITKEVDGKPRTFKKVYDSKKSLQDDQELQEFMGEDTRLNLWFGGANNFTPDFDELNEDFSKFYFHFNGDKSGTQNFSFFNSGDSAFTKILDLQMDELNDHMKTLDVKVSTNMKDIQDRIQLHFDDDGPFHYAFSDSLSEAIILKLDQHSKDGDESLRQVEVIVKKRLKITEDTEEFGKKGRVNTKDRLDLQNLSFYPNPAPNGRFRLRFDTPSESELAIKIYNLDGKEVFGRFFENHRGSYSEMIDLSGQSSGIYLLEITLNGKRLTRKIAIE